MAPPEAGEAEGAPDDWRRLLAGSQRLQRERGAKGAAAELAAGGAEAASAAQEKVRELMDHDTWEGRHGGLLLLQECLKWHQKAGEGPCDAACWVDACFRLLADKEPRLRAASGETIAFLCQLGGRQLYVDKVAVPLISSIEGNINLERDAQAFLDDDESTKQLAAKLLAGQAAQDAKRKEMRLGGRASRATSFQSTIFHDTAGWGTLETDVACLQQIVQRCGAELAPCLVEDGEALEVLLSCTAHLNRFVRGAAFLAVDAVVHCIQQADSAAGDSSESLLEKAADSTDLVSRVCAGVCDEWANVRMDASVVLRSFLLALGSPCRWEPHFDMVLPRMCVNRYYVAAGVASYSQETWKQVVGAQGREAVVKWLPCIAPFYVLQTKVANSEAREAACKCIGELAARIDPDAVRPFADELMEALVARLSRRDAWQVKLAAGLAVSDLVRAFPERFTLGADSPQLLNNLSALLADTVWSVRERAAVTLGDLVKVSDRASARALCELCVEGFISASRVPDERKKYGEEDVSALKKVRDNDPALHTDQESIDCCAVGDLDQDDSEQLPQALQKPDGKLNLSGLFMQAKEDQESLGLDTWERTDGCLYLARELALCGLWGNSTTSSAEGVAETGDLEDLMRGLASVSSMRHFLLHTKMLTTLWTLLPEIVRAVGAVAFTPHLGPLADSLAYSLSCKDPQTEASARGCAKQLAALLGREAFCEGVVPGGEDAASALRACLE